MRELSAVTEFPLSSIKETEYFEALERALRLTLGMRQQLELGHWENLNELQLDREKVMSAYSPHPMIPDQVRAIELLERLVVENQSLVDGLEEVRSALRRKHIRLKQQNKAALDYLSLS